MVIDLRPRSEVDSMSVTITDSGAIVLDKVVCDGYLSGHKIRVITHVHSDHLWGIEESIRDSDLICATPATKDLLEVMRGLYPPQIITPNYKVPFSYEVDTITLFPSEHILGAAQILVETQRGDKYLYSSDFVYEKIQAIKCDILVLDATYGHPSCTRPPFSKVKDDLIKLVQSELESKNSIIILGFYGKLQEIMNLLHEAKIEVPFINPPKVYAVSKIHEKYNVPMGEFYSALSKMGKKVLKDQQYIGFYHPSFKPRVYENTTYIHLTGWQFNIPYKKVGPKEYVVSFSGHADFKQLIKFVKESKPKLVITDNARPGSALKLAGEIKTMLGIEARPEPARNTLNQSNLLLRLRKRNSREFYQAI